MTFFFNLEALERETQCDPEYLVEALRLYYIKKLIPKNVHTRFKPIHNLIGNSFLINPDLFFKDKTTDILFKAQYIRLAGRRDYGAYKHFDIKYLDLSFFADLDTSKIKNNPLLTITENKIYFKYEEI
jgi:hypothetical protein